MVSNAAGKILVEKKRDEKSKSKYWKKAIQLYAMALPYYLMSVCMFYYPPMTLDIACQLQLQTCKSQISKTLNKVDYTAALVECQATRDACPTTDETLDDLVQNLGYRWPSFVWAVWTPMLVVFFELVANRMRMKAG